MKTFNTIAAALVVTAAFLTSAPPAVAATLSKEDDAAVRKIVTDFEKSWNTHDIKFMGSLFREDAEFVNIAGMHWRGRDAIVKAHVILDQSMFKNTKVKTEAIETNHLQVNEARPRSLRQSAA
jgi:ketosteroid isomerase-like protein